MSARVALAKRVHPKSVFQIAGPGAVGPGSLRGMPRLARLRDAGCAVWPFDAASAQTVVEVYPAVAVAGAGRVSDASGRRAFLDLRRRGVTARWPAAVESRDAFDAAVAAFLLAEHGRPDGGGGAGDLEGAVFFPA